MEDENYKVNYSSDPSSHPLYYLRLKSSLNHKILEFTSQAEE